MENNKIKSGSSIGMIVFIFILVLVFVFFVEFLNSYFSTDQVRIRTEASLQYQKQQAEIDLRREKEMAEYEASKTQDQKIREAVDDNSMSVGEYVGTRLIMNALGF